MIRCTFEKKEKTFDPAFPKLLSDLTVTMARLSKGFVVTGIKIW